MDNNETNTPNPQQAIMQSTDDSSQLPGPQKKKGKFLLLVVIVVLSAAIVLVYKKAPLSKTNSNSAFTPKQPGQQPQVEKSKPIAVIKNFPKDFPQETAMSESSGYKVSMANTDSNQWSIEYTSKKTLQENGKIFTDYLTSSGFNITNKIENSNSLFYYYGVSNKADLSVLVENKSGKVTVKASYLVK